MKGFVYSTHNFVWSQCMYMIVFLACGYNSRGHIYTFSLKHLLRRHSTHIKSSTMRISPATTLQTMITISASLYKQEQQQQGCLLYQHHPLWGFSGKPIAPFPRFIKYLLCVYVYARNVIALVYTKVNFSPRTSHSPYLIQTPSPPHRYKYNWWGGP